MCPAACATTVPDIAKHVPSSMRYVSTGHRIAAAQADSGAHWVRGKRVAEDCEPGSTIPTCQ
eukprot:2020241-Rhodomonas_salina.4